MKYVSWIWISTGVAAMKMPESPPTMKSETNAAPCRKGVWKWIFPFHIVPSQLNTLMAEGTAMSIVVTMKVVPSIGFIPLMNMWCPQTIHPRNAIPQSASTIEW